MGVHCGSKLRSLLTTCSLLSGGGCALEKSEHTRSENMILGQLKLWEYPAKCRLYICTIIVEPWSSSPLAQCCLVLLTKREVDRILGQMRWEIINHTLMSNCDGIRLQWLRRDKNKFRQIDPDDFSCKILVPNAAMQNCWPHNTLTLVREHNSLLAPKICLLPDDPY